MMCVCVLVRDHRGCTTHSQFIFYTATLNDLIKRSIAVNPTIRNLIVFTEDVLWFEKEKKLTQVIVVVSVIVMLCVIV